MCRPTDSSPFGEWVDAQPDPKWPLLTLTHIAQGNVAHRIIRSGEVALAACPVLGKPVAYYFYCRAAYRVGHADVVKLEADCPFCFIFDEMLIARADVIHPFDTGAFAKRLYNHVLNEGMTLQDFSLGRKTDGPNKLIAKVFGSPSTYFEGNRTKISLVKETVPAWELQARAYMELLASVGRNEPDDRIGSIEVAIDEAVPLRDNLRGIVVPHTVWSDGGKAPWLRELAEMNGVKIVSYNFVPGRHLKHYHGLLEAAVRDVYRAGGLRDGAVL